jgi:hypothetical protein
MKSKNPLGKKCAQFSRPENPQTKFHLFVELNARTLFEIEGHFPTKIVIICGMCTQWNKKHQQKKRL